MDQKALVAATVGYLRQFPADTLQKVLDELNHGNESVEVRKARAVAKSIEAADVSAVREIVKNGPLIPTVPTQNRDREAGNLTTLVKVLESFHLNQLSCEAFREFIHGFAWRKEDVMALSCSDLPPNPSPYHITKDPLPAMDHFTDILKWTKSRRKMKELCEAIQLLARNGGVIDLCQSRFEPKAEKLPDNAIEIAFLPHCSPLFLEQFVRQCRSRGINFTDRSKSRRRFGNALPRDYPRAVSNMDCIITGIYKDLFDHSNARGYSWLEISRLLQEKVAHLKGSKDLVDDTEDLALQQLAKVVGKIQAGLPDPKTDPHHENYAPFGQYAANSWYAINMAVAGLVGHDTETEEGCRRHVFTIRSRWDPRREWLRSTKLEATTGAKSKVTQKAWEEFYDFWELLGRMQGGKYETGPRKGDFRDWHDVEKDKWFVSSDAAKKCFKESKPEWAKALRF